MVIQKPISVHHVFLHLQTIVGMPFKCSHCSYLTNRAKAFPTMVNDDRFDLSGLIETTTPKVRKSTAKKKSIGQHFFSPFRQSRSEAENTPREPRYRTYPLSTTISHQSQSPSPHILQTRSSAHHGLVTRPEITSSKSPSATTSTITVSLNGVTRSTDVRSARYWLHPCCP
jgi:hypothetical protein